MSRLVARATLAVSLLVALMPAGGRGLAAQEPGVAVLERGPELRRGIDALAPDVTPHWYARYRIGDRFVDLIQVANPLAGPALWPVVPCAERQLRSADGRIFYHAHRQGWSLLVLLPPGDAVGEADVADVCRFVHRFIEELLLFEGLEAVRRGGEEPMFPAIVEL